MLTDWSVPEDRSISKEVVPIRKEDFGDKKVPRDVMNISIHTERPPAKYFFIHNSWSNKVLDVEGNNRRAGAKLIIYQKKDPPSDNQLWYIDDRGCIRSKLNGYSIDTPGGFWYNYARLDEPGGENPNQHWRYNREDQTIRNKCYPNMVLDIKGAWKFNCTKVIAHEYHGGENQRWELRYVQV